MGEVYRAFDEIDGRLFIDTRLVEGTNLVALLAEQGDSPPAGAINIVVHIASALNAAHADSLAHRDVKPSNVLLATTTGGKDSSIQQMLKRRGVAGARRRCCYGASAADERARAAHDWVIWCE